MALPPTPEAKTLVESASNFFGGKPPNKENDKPGVLSLTALYKSS